MPRTKTNDPDEITLRDKLEKTRIEYERCYTSMHSWFIRLDKARQQHKRLWSRLRKLIENNGEDG